MTPKISEKSSKETVIEAFREACPLDWRADDLRPWIKLYPKYAADFIKVAVEYWTMQIYIEPLLTDFTADQLDASWEKWRRYAVKYHARKDRERKKPPLRCSS